MHRISTALIGLLALGACATTPTYRINFLDQPVEVAVARYGPPDTVLDMPDGRRQYQWRCRAQPNQRRRCTDRQLFAHIAHFRQ